MGQRRLRDGEQEGEIMKLGFTTTAILVSLLARVCMVAVELARAGVVVIMKRFSQARIS